MRHYGQLYLNDYATVQQRGREVARDQPGFFRGEIAKGRGSDIAIILYASGTTGRPKGVVLSFDNLIPTAKNAIEFEGLTDHEEVLAWLCQVYVLGTSDGCIMGIDYQGIETSFWPNFPPRLFNLTTPSQRQRTTTRWATHFRARA
jgi:long-subunit acyl-CoA synthetase (AMP-forming)